ncbi:hypothetical protein BO83DRAFT_154922 [Aspergillus eucalypticola CBS 122712]|uniref:Uncharacterized protein n=1 Tax=Aspergillus eucalypticola (strain CBS 122712 / IBT 29274) TaxID=1448314 RepID=A0A317UPG9_ASPEC|nr:uncharacterized protein BO83DRAFT_154922 [Aspergillus eucalypticola CBS 122712]PWY63601.1 hypothetical protein BO83DRAFT_154922 [Aspergillus eucalypticola CBS 122712]
MGSKNMCKKSIDGVPKIAVASWRGCNGQYYLLEATNVNPLKKTADGLIYQAGLSSAVLGDWVSGNLEGHRTIPVTTGLISLN